MKNRIAELRHRVMGMPETDVRNELDATLEILGGLERDMAIVVNKIAIHVVSANERKKRDEDFRQLVERINADSES